MPQWRDIADPAERRQTAAAIIERLRQADWLDALAGKRWLTDLQAALAARDLGPTP